MTESSSGKLRFLLGFAAFFAALWFLFRLAIDRLFRVEVRRKDRLADTAAG